MQVALPKIINDGVIIQRDPQRSKAKLARGVPWPAIDSPRTRLAERLTLAKKRIVLALIANGGCVTVAGVDDHFVRKNEQLFTDGTQDLRKRAAGQVGATDAAVK